MLKYVGSKNKLSKELSPIIQKYIDDNNIKIYFEPFVGGMNMIDKIKCETKIGYDSHKELIEMWKELQKGWIPPNTITEEEYNKVKNNKDSYPSYYVGFVGFCGSFGAKYFGGYARGVKEDKITPRDMPNEAIRNILRQLPNVKDIKLVNKKFQDIDINKLNNILIYCDPPYQNTTKYSTDSFPHDYFWEWCRKVSKNNIVLISEYNAPDDFKCIWQKKHKTILDVGEHKERIEKLFIYKK